ncbi:ABC transporter ATP-binding protein [Desulfosporosinus sp. PR]|uniref:ABC transporter ATP-binding protein n=1 Tax=Candidatus Desulfosporosinus nitrosoreducens TaxID=3401928 RepID=UPI0027E77AEC|nr:ABC transporter ATP-binding protein [Desulfosporosinus sp. PR]MDQ7095740.1 ABC transporter ATP-binding protein [Desulfosporosinus sp. PR]
MSLTVCDLTFGYWQKHIINKLCLTAADGEIISLVGPNGSGKTTLLKCIAHIHRAKGGSVYVGDVNLGSLNSRELAKMVGYVPQDTSTNFPIDVFNAVLLGRTPYVRFSASDSDMNVVADCLCLMGLDKLPFRMLNELSGGERQRVFIARALAQEPQVLLLDEPTSNLDLRFQLETLRIVRDIARERDIIVVMAIHDLNLAGRFSDRIIMLKNGEILAQGSSLEVMNPENILSVYGVKAVVRVENGQPFIMPMEVQYE